MPFVPRSVLATPQPAHALDKEAQGDGHAGVAEDETRWLACVVPGVNVLIVVNVCDESFLRLVSRSEIREDRAAR